MDVVEGLVWGGDSLSCEESHASLEEATVAVDQFNCDTTWSLLIMDS